MHIYLQSISDTNLFIYSRRSPYISVEVVGIYTSPFGSFLVIYI